ncbi:MAG: glucosamine-6-phosphate deaminase [Ruminococcaceae bacterium]|nr:glucosamine-6-phosphate deaminase [Oscillospiraceae bacterium]
MKTIYTDKLRTDIFENRDEMGKAAARDISEKICELLKEKETVNIIFAAAPSQNDVLHYLATDKNIDWSRVCAFHMDEYVGLPEGAPQAFGNFLKDHIFGLVPLRAVNYIDSTATDAQAECERYAKILADNPTDIVIMGIGENGHIAFNDPGVAKFDDPEAVKIAELDLVCRNQQVHDGCFERLELVPEKAITLTVPTLVSAKYLFCIVPAPTKADAVKLTIEGEITEMVPATILRTHDNARMYLDDASSAKLVK